MNILYSAAESSISGANKSMCIVASHMIKKGHNVYVVIPSHGTIETELKERKIRYFIVKSKQWVQQVKNESSFSMLKCYFKKLFNKISICKIKKIIKEYDIDIVHNNSLSSYIAMVAAEEMNCKVVCHFREFLEEDHGLKISKIFNHKDIINKTSAMIAISECIYDKFSKIYDRTKMKMIYNGIEINEFIYNKKIFEKTTITISSIGRITEGKGQKELIRAVEEIYKEGKLKVKLLLIGNASSQYAQDLMAYVKRNRIADIIEFIPETTNIQSFYQNSDIIVVSSRNEAFGRVTIESMLTDNLVIGANTAGTKELIKNNEYGILYQVGDVKDLKEKIEYAINNKEKMVQIVKKSKQYAIKNFSAQRNAEQILDLYENI